VGALHAAKRNSFDDYLLATHRSPRDTPQQEDFVIHVKVLFFIPTARS
jgi:hypothetical protein